MKLTEIEEELKLAEELGQDVYHEWAEKYGRKLLAIAKATKKYMTDTDWPNRESWLAIIKALNDLEKER